MTVSSPRTSDFYANEQENRLDTILPVATAVPAFIGYTPKAEDKDMSYYGKAHKVSSLREFEAIYMPNQPSTAPYPQYYLVESTSAELEGKHPTLEISGQKYSLLPDPSTIYYLYNSVRLFYQNGGKDCYIVSVGAYGKPSDQSNDLNQTTINPNVSLEALKHGISILANYQEPNIYACPEATLLSIEDNSQLMQFMLTQTKETEAAICIFDIIGGKHPNPDTYTDDIQTFRDNTGTHGLDFGAAYFPFIHTDITQESEVNFTYLFSGNIKKLIETLVQGDINPELIDAIDRIKTAAPQADEIDAFNQVLMQNIPIYQQVMEALHTDINTLPTCGAMAGVYARIDDHEGVWRAPANTSIKNVIDLPITLTSPQQEDLNIDAHAGKSINALRHFSGQGIMVWGARTLDGNSSDWRYVPMRRMAIYLEQSIKQNIAAYADQPNNKHTWATIKKMITQFLTDTWNEGGLVGSTPDDAFQVNCDLGTTMTSEDILGKRLKVSVQVALTRPAEFIQMDFMLPMKEFNPNHN